MDTVEVEPDRQSFDRVARALQAESSGLEWRRDMSSDLQEALRPAVAAVRSALMSHGGGSGHEGQPLRAAIASKVQVVALRSGATIIAGKQGMPRDFSNAPKRFNSRSFRRRVYGSNTFVTQVGAPGWFDDTLARMHPRLRIAALNALEGRARRISRKA
jgi:hypothetical protein